MIHVAYYYLAESNLLNKVKKTLEGNKEYSLSTIDQADLVKGSGSVDAVVFEEEDSYLSCVDRFDQIMEQYKSNPAIIIISSNAEMFNTVRWMRRGATDCLWVGDINQDILINAIHGSIDFLRNSVTGGKKVKVAEVAHGRVEVPKNPPFAEMKDNEDYEMSLVMISIMMDKSAVGRYSSDTIQKMYTAIGNEAAQIATSLAGKVWYWQNDTGVIVFPFGDKSNLATIFAISFYLRFFLICYEKLKLDEVLPFSIAVHDGVGIYHKTNTDQITSDLLNSLVHLGKQYAGENDLLVTEVVYNKLAERIKLFFDKKGHFEDRDIYSYRFMEKE
jgi:hypothetical protein